MRAFAAGPSVGRRSGRALRRSARRSSRGRAGLIGPGARGATGCTGRWCGRASAGLAEPLRELGAAPFEQRDPVVAAQVAAERELQRERALVVGLVVGEEVGERRPPLLGDPVRLAGPAAGAGPAPLAGGGEVAVERTGRDEPGRPDSCASVSSIAPARSSRRSAGYSEPNEIPQSGPSVSDRRFFSSYPWRGCSARRPSTASSNMSVTRYIESIYRSSIEARIA